MPKSFFRNLLVWASVFFLWDEQVRVKETAENSAKKGPGRLFDGNPQ